MTLQHRFYTIETSETMAGSTISGHLTLDASHPIFEGHFPGTPVVPGVCMLQMVKEILEDTLNIRTRLENAESLKFLNVINPLENSRVTFSIRYQILEKDGISLQADLFTGETVCFKMKGKLRIED